MSTAILRVDFCYPQTGDRGEFSFQGTPHFISESAALVSYLVGHLNMMYGGDPENLVATGNELMAAWAAVKEGKGYEGEIVSVTIVE